MKVFDKAVVITKISNNEFNISVALNDACVITKALSRKDVEQLLADLEKILEEE